MAIGGIEEESYGRWSVKSFTDPDKVYEVKRFNQRDSHKYNGAEYGCTCPAWRFNPARTCKHTHAVEIYIVQRQEDVTVGGKRFIVIEVQKSRIEMMKAKDVKSLEDNF